MSELIQYQESLVSWSPGLHQCIITFCSAQRSDADRRIRAVSQEVLYVWSAINVYMSHTGLHHAVLAGASCRRTGQL